MRAPCVWSCAGALLLGSCGAQHDAPAPQGAVPSRPAVVAAIPGANPAPRYVEPPPPSSDEREPADVANLKLPQPEDTEPEPIR